MSVSYSRPFTPLMLESLGKKASVNVHTTKVLPEDASDHPVRRQYAPQLDLPAQWPSNPQPLTTEPKMNRWMDAFDISLILIAVGLLTKAVLCIVAWYLDSDYSSTQIDEVSFLTRYLARLNHTMTTLYTIIFSLIVTTYVRRIVLYRAQEGTATVAELEQFQASTSLPSTAKAIWSLRAFDKRSAFVSILLLQLWAWYYLGSQATAYEYNLKQSGLTEPMTLAYYNKNKTSVFEIYNSSDISPILLSNLNSKFNMYAQVQSNNIATDISGNALIPIWGINVKDFRHETHLSTDHHGWWDVSKSSTTWPSTNIGDVFYHTSKRNLGSTVTLDQPLIRSGTIVGDYEYSTSYLRANCSIPTAHTAAAFPNGTLAVQQVSINMTASTMINTGFSSKRGRLGASE